MKGLQVGRCHSNARLVFLCCSIVFQLVVSPTVSGGELAKDEGPLPTVDELIENVRANLGRNRLLLHRYTYNEIHEIVHLNREGQPKKTDISVFEVFPSLAGGLSYRRMISKNGKALSSKELLKQDRRHDQRVREYARKARLRGVSVPSELQAAEEVALREELARFEELFELFEFTILGREEIDQHPTLVVDFVPRPEYRVKHKAVRVLKKVRGRVWVSEADYQLVRVEFDVFKSVRIGWGILAKLGKGARLVYQGTKVNGEVWLPAEASFSIQARVLLVKGFRVQGRILCSGYRKFTVSSDVRPASEQRPYRKKPEVR